MARICVLAPHMWGLRVALHPLQSAAKLKFGAKIDFIGNFGPFAMCFNRIHREMVHFIRGYVEAPI